MQIQQLSELSPLSFTKILGIAVPPIITAKKPVILRGTKFASPDSEGVFLNLPYTVSTAVKRSIINVKVKAWGKDWKGAVATW